jgi:hypothetical protein
MSNLLTLKSPYVLSDIPGFLKAISKELVVDIDTVEPALPNESQYFSITNYSTKVEKENENDKEDVYKILKYKKDLLAFDLVPMYGLLRSVIVNSEKEVISFAPPKSIAADIFMNMHSQKTKDIIAEDFIEGTMINVFFDRLINSWRHATRSTVDAKGAFYCDSSSVKKSFSDMFIDACSQNNLSLGSLNPQFCYSFVLQHPLNRIVVPLKVPQLYLVEVYEIINTNNNEILVYPQDMQSVRQHGRWTNTSVLFPITYEFSSYSELIEKFASPNTPYNIMGIVLKNTATNLRTKIRNPIYEEVRHLRGNQPKLQYQYLTLRHSGQLPEYLKFYPEAKAEFSAYRDKVHMFTETLHKNYISCYVKKQKPLNEFEQQYKTNMFKIHEIYLNELRGKGLHVTNTVVINYVNKIPPRLLMFHLSPRAALQPEAKVEPK